MMRTNAFTGAFDGIVNSEEELVRAEKASSIKHPHNFFEILQKNSNNFFEKYFRIR
jgi:hypothetical protein